MNCHSVKRVQFGILSPDEIRRMSVTDGGIRIPETKDGKPKEGGLMDPRQGPIDKNSPCQTCDGYLAECPGHFGHIDLAKPVFHIGFLIKTMKILRCVCFFCSKLLVCPNDPKIKKIITDTEDKFCKRLTLIHDLCRKKNICGDNVNGKYGCGRYQPNFIRTGLDINAEWMQIDEEFKRKELSLTAQVAHEILQKITDEDSLILGIDTKYSRPEWMIITVLPVPPLTIRPTLKSTVTVTTKQDDLTKILSDIISVNNELIQNEESANIITENTKLLQLHIAFMIDNNLLGLSPVMKKLKKPLKSLAERFKGNDGRIRGNLLGKRVNFAAHSIVTPDPNLQIDQIGIPQSVAKNLTFPELVTPFNIEKLQQIVNNGDDKYPGAKSIVTNKGEIINLKSNNKNLEIQCGYKVERHIQNNDLVIGNHRPSFQKMSMLGHRVKVLPWSTFRMNVSCLSSYKADADGDEINLHVPQSFQSRAEIENIHMVSRQIITPQANIPTMGIVEDALLGATKMTERDLFIEKNDMMNLLMFSSNWNGKLPKPCILKPKPLWSGKQLFSQLIPKNLNYIQTKIPFEDSVPWKWILPEETTVLIENGELLMGVLCKKTLGSNADSLLHVCMLEFGHIVCAKFCNDIQNVMNNFLLLEGHSISIDDTIVNPVTYMEIVKAIKKVKENVIELIQKGLSMEIDRSNFDYEANQMLCDNNDDIGDILKTCFTKKNNLMTMMKSGSAGLFSTVTQIIGCVGQQNVDCKRIPFGFRKRTLPHFIKDDYGPESRGFIENTYLSGLTPSEFYFQSMEGRSFLVECYLTGNEIGRIQRRLVKAMESLMVHYDGTVRNSRNQLIQLRYGEDGLCDEALEFQKLPSIRLSNEDFEKKFKFDPSNEDLRGVFNEDVWQEMINTGESVSNLEKEFEQLNQDRTMLKTIFTKCYFPLPCNLKRMVWNAQNMFNIKQERTDLSPLRVIQGVKDLLSKCVIINGDDKFNKEANQNATLLFQCLVRSTLCTKAVADFHLSTEAFEWLIREIELRFQRAIVPPGEMVGALAAQSICDSFPYMDYKTIHFAGVSSINMVQGMPRIKEIINISKTPKYPSLSVYLNQDTAKCPESVYRVLCRLEHTTLKNLIASSAIYYDPDVSNTVILYDQEFVTVYDEIVDFDPTKLSPWLLRIVLDRKKKIQKRLTMQQIVDKLESIFGDDLNIIFNDDNAEHLILRIRIMNNDTDVVSKYQNDDSPDEVEDDVFLKRIESFILNDITVQGHDMINKVHMIHKETNDVTNTIETVEKVDEEFMLVTEGTNLMNVLLDRDVDSKKTFSNDIHEIFNILGIEAVRKSIETEMISVINGYHLYVNYRHFALLSEVMTAEGHLTSIDRHGFDRHDLGALLRWSAKEKLDVLFDAACHGEIDPIKGVTEKNIFGQLPRIGTGCFDLLLDKKILQGKDF